MEKAPRSILIVGSGVFGLSTAWALAKRPFFDKTSITIVDHARGRGFPPEDAASMDASRIIRADYADPVWAKFAAEASEEWRKHGDAEIGGQGRYKESGFVVTAHHSSKAKAGKMSGMDYTKASYENVTKICAAEGLPNDKILELGCQEDIQEYMCLDKACGDWGYVNKLSGWANNGEGMKWMYEQVKKTGRVKFIDALVKELVAEGQKVTGAKLSDGSVLGGDIVYVAAGAWTGSLIDLRGRCEATGQVLGYVGITKEEEAVLQKQPVVINFTNGLFVFPAAPGSGLLKAARHGFGYVNPQTVTTALPLSPSHNREPIVVSLPRTSRDDGISTLPAEANRDLRKALKELVPVKGLENRPWLSTRLCWYSDTRDADWLVDWHPGWEGLFVATGDSGHGFKFLPVIGEKLADCLEGKGGKLGDKWKWKDVPNDGQGTKATNGIYQPLITYDGSRGGKIGMVLDEELNKTGDVTVKSNL